MKCPVCDKGKITKHFDGTYECNNPECPAWYEIDTTVFETLIRTRKALDLAINVLNRVKDVKYEEYIDEKLEQINKIIDGKEW